MSNNVGKIAFGPPRPPLLSAVEITETGFVNKGLDKWVRDRHLFRQKDNERKETSMQNNGAKKYDDDDIDEVIDIVVTNRWRTMNSQGERGVSFPTPIPLKQMVEILVDVWEADE